MSWRKKYQSSFNGYPIRYPELISRPEHYAKLNPSELISIARGAGGSYGDAALNQQGEIILTGRCLIFSRVRLGHIFRFGSIPIE